MSGDASRVTERVMPLTCGNDAYDACDVFFRVEEVPHGAGDGGSAESMEGVGWVTRHTCHASCEPTTLSRRGGGSEQLDLTPATGPYGQSRSSKGTGAEWGSRGAHSVTRASGGGRRA